MTFPPTYKAQGHIEPYFRRSDCGQFTVAKFYTEGRVDYGAFHGNKCLGFGTLADAQRRCAVHGEGR